MYNIKAVKYLAVLVAGLCVAGLVACKEKNSTPPPPPKPAIDLTNWKADPSLPKPVLTPSVEIIKEPERKKISMKVTVTEANGLTVHEVHFVIKYRTKNPETGEYEYPENRLAYKMLPKVSKGKGVFKTPFVEKMLVEVAWQGENDNWEIEIKGYNQYYKE